MSQIPQGLAWSTSLVYWGLTPRRPSSFQQECSCYTQAGFLVQLESYYYIEETRSNPTPARVCRPPYPESGIPLYQGFFCWYDYISQPSVLYGSLVYYFKTTSRTILKTTNTSNPPNQPPPPPYGSYCVLILFMCLGRNLYNVINLYLYSQAGLLSTIAAWRSNRRLESNVKSMKGAWNIDQRLIL